MKLTRLTLILLIIATVGCKRTPLDVSLLSYDPAAREKAVQKLAKLPDEQKKALLPPLIKGLESEDPQVVRHAVDALVLIGPVAIPPLTASLKNENAYVRLSAAEALGDLGPSAGDAVPTLMESLKDQHPLVREEAILALVKITPASEPLVDSLITSLKDSDEDVSATAAESLKQIDSPKATAALKKLKPKKIS